ncbi:hypothetical protein MAPG_11464 [Magnaporthiopsis poae ATCC 64411]|uniref:Flavodoxin-like domain-containing protein n=1 Tax=Magnaporthiopsis poae (strain ATCC 64411 / 73-15) TaxID=644358 RepID=A0A0C4EFC1_MAGP6|nr:hypothetical protein MAPG_11464 [Magnaporthiopsis poae ATCC 64411]
MPLLSASKHEDSEGTVQIPTALGPIPFIGTVPLIDPEYPVASFNQMAAKYGEIYRMIIPGRPEMILISSQALVNELCDEKRFEKTADGNVLEILRSGVPDGIFTAHTKDEVWGAAHRILIPAFGPVAIQGMFDDMYDIAAQLALKWARHGSSAPILATDDLTRMTLDTIALCSMGFRFNSYYHDELHPFILTMSSWLRQASDRFQRPFPDVLYRIFAPGTERAWAERCAALGRTASEVLEARKKNPAERKDLLTAMMEGADPKTGLKLSEQTIIDNLVTFLIAGHETTSGMLAFSFVELLKSPQAYRKVQEEVDRVVGRERVRLDHLPKLKYINAVLKECLRLNPTIPGIGLRPHKDEIVAGKYLIKSSDNIFLLFGPAHVDPAVWGDTARQFIPERMLDENFEPLERKFPNCWKPFGNGVRACIGRAFAWQEAVMAMAVLFQNFNFVAHDPDYKLKVKETLTIKPDGFTMRAMLRHGMTPTELEQRLAGGARSAGTTKQTPSPLSDAPTISGVSTPTEGMKPLSIYYGSNSGTCEALAHRLAADASVQGFRAVAIDVLDAANGRLPKTGDHPVVFITASYEGQPPDNAAHFVAWLESLKNGGGEMEGVNYAVFGCGHRDWARTFHRIPKLVDSKLAELGGARLAPLGVTDAADGNTFLDFETWEFEKLWPALAARYSVEPKDLASALESVDATTGSLLTVEVSNPRSAGLRQDVGEAVVTAASQLTAAGVPAKRHIEIQLPSSVPYTAGRTTSPPSRRTRAERAVKHAFFQAVVKGAEEGVEADREEMQEWYETVRNKRYAADLSPLSNLLQPPPSAVPAREISMAGSRFCQAPCSGLPSGASAEDDWTGKTKGNNQDHAHGHDSLPLPISCRSDPRQQSDASAMGWRGARLPAATSHQIMAMGSKKRREIGVYGWLPPEPAEPEVARGWLLPGLAGSNHLTAARGIKSNSN